MVSGIINYLKNIKGLGNIYLLDDETKKFINKEEEKNNSGVRACLKRKYTIVLTHNSDFREPIEDIVIKDKRKIIFPPVSFPEVNAKNVVSSSPSKKIHDFLVKKFNLKLREEATLLIGFD